MNRRRLIIALTCAFYALQLVLLWFWHDLAPEGSRSFDLVIAIAVGIGIALIDAGVARYLLGALKRAEEAYAADVSTQLERSLEIYRETAEREEALAREVGRAVDEELTRARKALAEGDSVEASSRLREGLDIASKTRASYCDNVPIAAVLETKEHQCAEAGVGFEHHVVLPEELPLPEVEIAAVFFNLIDNALHECQALLAEGSEGMGRPSVKVRSLLQAGQLFVQVENPQRTKGDKRPHDQYATSLSRQHGWGTQIVRRIAKEHGGIVEFESGEGSFGARVMIPLPKADA